MSINDLFSATFNSLRRAKSAATTGGRKAHHHHHHHEEEAAAEWPAVSEWTRKQVRAYFKRQLQLDEYVGALRRAKVDGARLVALHHADALYTTLGVTKIGHKKKLMVALRGLLQAVQADASTWPAVADTDHHRPCVEAGLRVRRATMAAADDQHNDHHRHHPGKNENDEVVVAGAAKNERTKATTTVPPPLDWAKLQRSRSSPVDEVVSVVSSAESADSPRSQLQHSPRPATTRSAGRSPRQQLASHPIARTGPRVHIQLRDLDLPPTFGSAVVPAVSTMSHDTASTNAVAWSLPVSPAGSHVFGAIGTPSSPSSSPPPLHHHHHRQSAAPTCTTLAYSRAFGGVAVKCVYGDDVSMLRFHFAGACTESGDDSDSESESESDSDGDERKEEADKLHFVELRDAIRAAYGRNLRVKYSDRDGDTINIDSDASLNYAFNDWRGQIGLVDHHHHHHQTTTSWRLHLHDFDDDHDHHHHHHHHHHGYGSSSSSLSSPSSSSSLFLASSTVHDTVVETPSRRKLCK